MAATEILRCLSNPWALPQLEIVRADCSVRGITLPRFTEEGLYRAVARCCSAHCDSFVVHLTWCSTTFSSCSPRTLEQRVYGTLDRTRWTNSMACSFPQIKSLIISSQVTSTVYCLYYSSQWLPALAVTHAGCIWDDTFDDWNFPADQAIFVQTCNVLRWNSVWTLWEFSFILRRP